ncbi:hypothetical protein K0M31_006996 [Melipona bicolor]|uniref:Uncharacterized protein n=1 Tax=Melipona bicolor TaxID=60889 RepID=A0AA40FRG1_9HYME|nr:hypothetical protein K0M31_006996 [Melipona bicolor]
MDKDDVLNNGQDLKAQNAGPLKCFENHYQENGRYSTPPRHPFLRRPAPFFDRGTLKFGAADADIRGDSNVITIGSLCRRIITTMVELGGDEGKSFTFDGNEHYASMDIEEKKERTVLANIGEWLSLADSVAPKALYPRFFLGRGNKEVGPLLKKTESRQYRVGPADCLRKQ